MTTKSVKIFLALLLLVAAVAVGTVIALAAGLLVLEWSARLVVNY